MFPTPCTPSKQFQRKIFSLFLLFTFHFPPLSSLKVPAVTRVTETSFDEHGIVCTNWEWPAKSHQVWQQFRWELQEAWLVSDHLYGYLPMINFFFLHEFHCLSKEQFAGPTQLFLGWKGPRLERSKLTTWHASREHFHYLETNHYLLFRVEFFLGLLYEKYIF